MKYPPNISRDKQQIFVGFCSLRHFAGMRGVEAIGFYGDLVGVLLKI